MVLIVEEDELDEDSIIIVFDKKQEERETHLAKMEDFDKETPISGCEETNSDKFQADLIEVAYSKGNSIASDEAHPSEFVQSFHCHDSVLNKSKKDETRKESEEKGDCVHKTQPKQETQHGLNLICVFCSHVNPSKYTLFISNPPLNPILVLNYLSSSYLHPTQSNNK